MQTDANHKSEMIKNAHAVRSRPRNSPHPFPVRTRPRSQARLITSGFFSPPISSHSHPLPCTHAVRRRPRNSQTHFPSAAVRAAKLADFQRLLLPTHFQPPLHPRCPQPSAQPSSLISSGFFSHSFLSLPFSFFPSFPFLFPSFPILSLPFPSFPLHPRRPHTTVQTSSLPHAVKRLNENPSIEDTFGKKDYSISTHIPLNSTHIPFNSTKSDSIPLKLWMDN